MTQPVASPQHEVPRLVDGARSQMSPAMHKVAELLEQDPAAPLRMTITELAERAGTSPASVSRFCRVVGFGGYLQFRVAVAKDVGRAPATVEIGTAFHSDDDPEQVLQSLLAGHVGSLRETASQLDLVGCLAVASAIAHAGRVDLYGVGGSAWMASEMAGRLFRVGVNTRCWSDVHDGLSSASQLDGSDVAIGLSNSGHTRETVEMLACARRAGAHTIALTSHVGTALQRVAHTTLVAAVSHGYLHPADLIPKHSQLLVLDLLYILVVQQDYTASLAKLDVSATAVLPHKRAVAPAHQESFA